jgi:capsid protein
MSPDVAAELHQLDELERDIARGIASAEPPLPRLAVSQLATAAAPVRVRYDDGEKFYGGFGPTDLLVADYWTLRARSSQLFEQNLYARGIIRRFVTNVINTGLHLEASPDEKILGFEEDALSDWSELIENRFELWEENAWLCDHRELETFGQIQAAAFMEALVAGDVLSVLRQDPRTGLPRVQLIKGSAVQTPMGVTPQRGNRIVHGVELDAQDRHVAYWVTQADNTAKRLPAWGEKSGRRIAWLVYATERRLDDVRGKPILSLALQSLREIDRYRDSVQRKAVINSMLAMWIKKSADKMGTLPLTGGAIRREAITETDEAGTRSFKMMEHIPGLVLEELQQGEEPVGFDARGTDEKFGEFEEAIVQVIAWAMETPPEILRLAFTKNYSASQAAINEYKMFLNRVRTWFGSSFCAPIYQEWLLSEALNKKVDAPGLLEAWRENAQYDVFCAWIASEWSGQIKPAVDLSKLVGGYTAMVAEGFITRDRAARELTGTKYSKNIKRLRIENEQLAEALAPIAPPAPATSNSADESDIDRDDDDGDDENEEEAA